MIPKTFANLENEEDIKYFVVTAYYSPLPWQENYYKGNYEDEIKLNWNWIRWASWLEVFEWMFAWPKSYSFWTIVYIEWIWTWVIADRGSAIVEAWQRWYKHDRIDVWMWHWDEWLKKTLAWGKRTVAWKIIESNDWLNDAILKAKLEIDLKSSSKIIKSLYNSNFWYESSSEDIKFFQEELKKRWLYNWEIDWIYNKEISDFVLGIQFQNWIIKSKNDYWAWYWWRKTRSIFIKKEQEIIKNIGKNNFEMIVENSSNIKNNQEEIKTEKKSIVVKKDVLNTYVSPESSKKDVKNLQEKLASLNLYNWEINWEYKDLKISLINFQIKNNVIKNENDYWAWYFGPETRKELKKYNEKIEFERKQKELVKKENNDLISKIWIPKFWDTSEEVRNLQKTLISLWYFDWKDTWYFWPKTRQSILNFQIDHKLVLKDWDPWSGKIWEKTKSIMKEKLFSINNWNKEKILAMK